MAVAFRQFLVRFRKAGIHCELRGASYTGPLLNLYRPAYPESWYNNGKGGFRINRNGNLTTATAYSGARTLQNRRRLDVRFFFAAHPGKESK